MNRDLSEFVLALGRRVSQRPGELTEGSKQHLSNGHRNMTPLDNFIQTIHRDDKLRLLLLRLIMRRTRSSLSHLARVVPLSIAYSLAAQHQLYLPALETLPKRLRLRQRVWYEAPQEEPGEYVTLAELGLGRG